jgi:DNA-binding NtrC family response regulator
VQGANGTGKDLFAAAIHEASARAQHPLVRVNCSAVPESLLDAELFGQEEGRSGRAFAARGGTLLLKEVGALPLSAQARLLRLLESGEVQPPGTASVEKLDVRVIATTSRPLDPLVADGRLRRDLFYRLNVIAIRVPELSERAEDIPLLVDHFLARFNNRMGRAIRGADDEVIARLLRHRFAGNVRELENVLEHAYVVARGPMITVADLPPYVTGAQRQPAPLPAGGAGERDTILQVLQRNRWSILRAAEDLGVHRTTLWRKIKRLKISRP